jgi:hypothetical protein
VMGRQAARRGAVDHRALDVAHQTCAGKAEDILGAQANWLISSEDGQKGWGGAIGMKGRYLSKGAFWLILA